MARFSLIDALKTNFYEGEVYLYHEVETKGLINGYAREVSGSISSFYQLGRKLGYKKGWAEPVVLSMRHHLEEFGDEQFLKDYLMYENLYGKVPYIVAGDRSPRSYYAITWEDQLLHMKAYEENPVYREQIDSYGESYIDFSGWEKWHTLYVSCKYANAQGLRYEDVEPWLHLRSFTNSGHDRVGVERTILFLHKVFEGNNDYLSRLGSLYWDCRNHFAYIIRFFDEEKRTEAAIRLITVLQEYEICILSERMFQKKDRAEINGKTFTKQLTVAGLLKMLKRLKYEYAAEIKKEGHKGYDEVARTCHDENFKNLAEKFIAVFGRAPKALNLLGIAMQEQHKSEDEVVSGFSVKAFSVLKEKVGMYTAARLSVKLGKAVNSYIALERPVLRALASADVTTCAWVLKHRETAAETLCWLIEADAIVDINMTLAEATKRASMFRSNIEMDKLEKKYDFEFEDQSFLQPCSVTKDGATAFVMQAGDTRMCTIGYDTSCCQHLNGAGETAMMYGLLADNAGFWAIEKNHKIIAQAEIWEGTLDEKPVLCFDNIELADDRDFSYIKEILTSWVKASSYSDIVMGTGYNVLTYGYEYAEGDLTQPYSYRVPNPYTDARTGQIVWLKKGGEVA